MKRVFLTCAALFVSLSAAFSQDVPTREIGLRTNGFNDLGFVYKKQKSENVYKRYRLAFGNLGLGIVNGSSLVNLSVGGAIGKEKRKSINDRFQVVYGTEFIPRLTVSHSPGGNVSVDDGTFGKITITGSGNLLLNTSLGIGFMIGAQYNISPKWYVSAEVVPTVSLNGTFGSGVTIYGLNAAFTSSNVGLTGMYRF
ncbi:hypothetical protein [Siphonobacter curvatus]|uniref:Outer membrane protein beta-barrel domain-containing protein n=1 Tax=Siphonobacter curvatus TaxID=2094562 RepID=A0A2S7ISN2_9BACT|nr:hypothetical protein [Siphonobacter curvatus]PQA60638.1 hypothetical protein C5O19_13785 [Siphonobacter curvatus]